MGTLVSLAWRNLWRNSRRTAITMSTIAFGLALSILMFVLNDGAHSQMIRDGIRMGQGNLTLQPQGYQDAPANHLFIPNGRDALERLSQSGLPGRIAPRVELQVLAATAANSQGVGLFGLDLHQDPWVENFGPNVVSGDWPAPEDTRGLAIGSGVARKLKARVGSKVIVMSGTTAGDVEAHLARVRAVFDTGIGQIDDFMTISGLDFARRFLLAEGGDPARQPVTRVALFLENDSATAAWSAQLREAGLPGDAALLPWQEVMPDLVTYIVLDDAGGYVWVVIIFIMVTFGILNTILMSVLERTREFGLLRALGMGRARLLALVATETLILALGSLALGWLIGAGLHAYFAAYGLDLSGMYPEGVEITGTFIKTTIYSELRPGRAVDLSILALAATLLSGIYPAIKAARVLPVVALQT